MGKHRKDKALDSVPQQQAIISSFPMPPQRKAEEYLTAYQGYVYTAVSAIAHEVASIKLHLYKSKTTQNGEEINEVTEHKAMSLLHYCNPFMTLYDLLEATVVYQHLVGEAFWIVLRQGGDGAPTEIWPVRPDWMGIVPDNKNFIKEYTYSPGGNLSGKISIPTNQVIHFKGFNPTNPYRGKGTVQAGAMPIDIHTFAQEWNRNFFFNNATPGLVFTTEKKINRKIIERFLQSWQNTYGGRRNAHKVAFLDSGFKMEKTTMSAKDLDFSEQQRLMRDDILAVFKVPKTILGMTEGVTVSNAFATNQIFMERVISPFLQKFLGQLNEFYLPMFGDEKLFFDFEDPTPEDVDMKLKTYENALLYHWMTPNEVRAMENLEPLEGGDTLIPNPAIPEQKMEDKSKKYQAPKMLRREKHMVGARPDRPEMVEAKEVANAMKPEIRKLVSAMLQSGNVKAAPVQVKNVFALNKEEKDLVWKQFAGRTESHEEELVRRMQPLWENEREEVLRNLEQIKHWVKARRKGRESSILPSWDDQKKTFLSVFSPYLRELVYEEGNFILDFIGVGGQISLTKKRVAEFLRKQSSDAVTNITGTTREDLKRTLAEGIEKEESIPQLRNRVQHVYKVASTSRSTTIARTEVIKGTNFATEEAYIQSGVVKKKEWLATRDLRVREDHLDADGQIVNVTDRFEVGGERLRYPGDPEGRGDNIINCRCTLIPVVE